MEEVTHLRVPSPILTEDEDEVEVTRTSTCYVVTVLVFIVLVLVLVLVLCSRSGTVHAQARSQIQTCIPFLVVVNPRAQQKCACRPHNNT